MQDCVFKLSEGKPGALTAMMRLIENGAIVDPYSVFGAFTPLFNLDSYEIYGSRIWMLYKDVCGGDPVKVLTLLHAVQLGLLPNEVLQNAIDNHGKGLPPIDEVLTLVQKRLPNFAK